MSPTTTTANPMGKHWSTCDLRTGNATTCSCADQEQVQTKGGE